MTARRLRPRPFDRVAACRPALRGARPRGARRASSARRCSSTTRTSCGAGAAAYVGALRRRTRSRTRARRSCAPRWPGWSPTRACTSTSPPAASCTSRCSAGFPPDAHRVPRQQQVATPSSQLRARRRRRAHRRRLVRRARPARGARRRAAAPRRACSCGSRPASRRTPTSTSRPAPTTRSSASRSRPARRATPRCAVVEVRRAASSAGSTATSGRRSCVLDSYARRRRGRRRARRRASSARPATPIDELNLGGGLGARYLADDPTPSSRRVRRVLRGALARPRADAGLDRRARADGRAGPLDRRARRRSRSTGSARSRRSPASRTYVAVDGGMSDNPRPGHSTAPATRRTSPPGSTSRGRSRAPSSGKHCEQGDVLVRRRPPPGRRRGRRPARHPGHRRVRLLDGVELQQGARARRSCSCATAQARVVVRRETLDDLVATGSDVIAEARD